MGREVGVASSTSLSSLTVSEVAKALSETRTSPNTTIALSGDARQKETHVLHHEDKEVRR